MAIDLDDIDALVKKRYASKKPLDLTIRECPTLAMIPKVTKFGGKDFTYSIIGGNPQGLGAKFKAAQDARDKGGSQGQIAARRGRGYGVFAIDTETLLATEESDDAFLAARTRELDGIDQAMMFNLSVMLFRDGTGRIGTIKAGEDVTTDTVALTNIGDVRHFSPGMKVSLVAAGAYRNAGGNGGATAEVESVDEENGTVTFTTNLDDAIAAADVGDQFVRDGDYQANPAHASNKLLNIAGFDAWIPTAAPGATPFFGLDRSVLPVRYGGVRYNNNGGAIKKLLTKLASKIRSQGGHPKLAVMDFDHVEQLCTELDAKKTYQDSAHAGISFEVIEVHTPAGTIKVLGDDRCQADRTYMLQPDTWELRTMGGLPRILDQDGNKSQRVSDDDAVEYRLGFWGQLICYAPGYNGVGLF